MLYLTRKLGESIIINNNVTVKVVEVRGRSVKLGFEFPQDVSVLRKEVHDRIVEENMAAGKQGQGDDFTDALANVNFDKPKE